MTKLPDEALERWLANLRGLQPALNVMAREVLDDIIGEMEAAISKVRSDSGCYCTGRCMAPRIMGRQTRCLRSRAILPGQALAKEKGEA